MQYDFGGLPALNAGYMRLLAEENSEIDLVLSPLSIYTELAGHLCHLRGPCQVVHYVARILSLHVRSSMWCFSQRRWRVEMVGLPGLPVQTDGFSANSYLTWSPPFSL
jgi:hypothetical protein